MYRFVIVLICIILITNSYADVSVRGYYRKDGTYVQPHHRSDPNRSQYDNWSTKGNINPYTGKEGTKNVPYKNHYDEIGNGSVGLHDNSDSSNTKLYIWDDLKGTRHFSDKSPPLWKTFDFSTCPPRER